MKEHLVELDVELVDYDHDNPRIAKALEKYGSLTAERIAFALKSATENGSASSYNNLRDSILASRGIMAPITVIARDGRYTCIDGNTRLAIYKKLLKTDERKEVDWSKIKATVLQEYSQTDIEKIRVSAHLVGSREWPAYEKARYLHYLRNQEFMDYAEIIALCGGRRNDIERQIDAYHDMNEYYRDKVDEDAEFQIDRFSGFVEVQKPGIKDSIFSAGFTMDDFGGWIRYGNIYRLADVRQLPRVLENEDAREIFVKGGPKSIEKANQHLDLVESRNRPLDKEATLESATMYQLVEVLLRRISDISYSEVRSLKNRESDNSEEQIRSIESLSEQLKRLLDDLVD